MCISLPAHAQHPVVHPDPREVVPERPRLGDLVLVVRVPEIHATAYWISKRVPRCFSDTRRALDVPAGPSLSRATPTTCPPPACSPSRARSRGDPPSGVRLLLTHLLELLTGQTAVVEAYVLTEVDVARGLVALRRRRAPRSSRSVGHGPDSRQLDVERPSPSRSVSSRYHRVARSASAALSPGAAS